MEEKDYHGGDTSGEFSVTFKGFKSQEDADRFIRWYDGSGEQDCYYWFDEALYTYNCSSITTKIIGNNVTKILVAHPNKSQGMKD